jgi:uncharacterized protein DUF4166
MAIVSQTFRGARQESREEDGRFHFFVELPLPLAGLVIRYRGWLIPD